MNRLKDKYINEVMPNLQEEFGVNNKQGSLVKLNKMAVPKLEKVMISVSLGEAKDNSSLIDKVKTYLLALSGQLPVVTLAKKSISAFRVSKGQPVGMVITLRGERMYSFLDKLVNIVLPRVRDFKGISEKSLDSNGNLNLGMREQAIFPEIDYKTIDKTRGLCITVVTSAKQKDQSKRLLELLGIPFRG